MLDIDVKVLERIRVDMDIFEKRISREFGINVRLSIVEAKSRVQDRPLVQPSIFIRLVKEHIATCCAVTRQELESSSRERPLCDLRAMAYRIIRDALPNTSYKKIGSSFGGRDHSTVMHGLKNFDDLYQTDEHFRNQFYHLKKQLRNVNAQRTAAVES